MNENEMIEEMTKKPVAELRLFYNFCKYNGCEEKTADDCERCYFREVYIQLAQLEGKIKNGTLKEIPEGSVVLTKEEYEELNITGKYFNEALKQSRKETAKEILFKVESAFAYYDNEDMFSKKAILERVEEIAKQYGVEV